MVLGITAIVLLSLAAMVSGQALEVIESDKVCTQWMMVTGSDLTANINTSPCSGPINYELRAFSTTYIVRFCCPHKSRPEPELGPSPAGCGRQVTKPLRTRIVGGQEATPHSWPWLVSLQYGGNHFCGGTLIDENHVLTAAHCFQDDSMDTSQLSIVAGLHRRSVPHPERSQRRQVTRIFNHEAYDDHHNENDVAVLRLARPVTLNSYVNVACLPGKEPSVHESVMIAGWGTTSFGGNAPDSLQQANIMIMDTCKYVYKYDNSKQVCAGNHQYSKDSCQGDSGGPLMNEVNGQWHVNGVVSYGDECAKQGSAGVYARVSHYLPWIRSKMAIP